MQVQLVEDFAVFVRPDHLAKVITSRGTRMHVAELMVALCADNREYLAKVSLTGKASHFHKNILPKLKINSLLHGAIIGM